MMSKVHTDELEKAMLQKLAKRGVCIRDIGKVVYETQAPYNPGLSLLKCEESVSAVLKKREIQHAVLVGIELDELAEKRLLSEPLQKLVETDDPLFGCDETLALGAAMGYGSVSVTTFGFLDKHKIGIIKELDTNSEGRVHTFLDDLVASIASAAAGRIAHLMRDEEQEFGDMPTIAKEKIG